jgi:YD repeat-containing protein
LFLDLLLLFRLLCRVQVLGLAGQGRGATCRLVNTMDPAGGVTHATYDTDRDLLSTTDPNGARSEATNGGLGRPITKTQTVRQRTPIANTTTLSYGFGGWLDSTPAHGPVVLPICLL